MMRFYHTNSALGMSWTSIGHVEIDTKPKYVLMTSSFPKQVLTKVSYLTNEKDSWQDIIC